MIALSGRMLLAGSAAVPPLKLDEKPCDTVRSRVSNRQNQSISTRTTACARKLETGGGSRIAAAAALPILARYLEDEHDLHLVVDPGLHQQRLVARVLGVPLHPRDVLVVPPLLVVFLVLVLVLIVPHPPPHAADGSVRARIAAAADEAGQVPETESARWGSGRVRERSAGAVVEAAGSGGGRRVGQCGGAVQHHAGWMWSERGGSWIDKARFERCPYW